MGCQVVDSDDLIGNMVFALYLIVAAIYTYLLFGGGLIGLNLSTVSYPYPAVLKVQSSVMYVALFAVSITMMRVSTKKWTKIGSVGTFIIATAAFIGQYLSGGLNNPITLIEYVGGLAVAGIFVMIAFFGD